jgi:16S rRNA (adenine1518-N6/adenine1519-N6)-dimethyltransferase
MNLTSPTQIKEILSEEGIRPTKRFGQNFLINKGLLEKIIKVSNIKKTDIILEVGPGLGVLTKELAKKSAMVLAVEKDKKMVAILKKVLKEEEIENVKIINDDILSLSLDSGILNTEKSKGFSKLSAVGGKSKERNESYSKVRRISAETFDEQMRQSCKSYKVIANIPYNITSAIIRKFLEEDNKPTEIILMVQKEVAQRICKKDKMSLLSLSVQFYADPKILFYVQKRSFFPAPKIDSAIIKITPKEKTAKNSEIFFKLIKAGFSSPRKLLIKNLSEGLGLEKENLKKLFEKVNLSPKIRAENLKIQDWLNLSVLLET